MKECPKFLTTSQTREGGEPKHAVLVTWNLGYCPEVQGHLRQQAPADDIEKERKGDEGRWEKELG